LAKYAPRNAPATAATTTPNTISPSKKPNVPPRPNRIRTIDSTAKAATVKRLSARKNTVNAIMLDFSALNLVIAAIAATKSQLENRSPTLTAKGPESKNPLIEII